MTEIIYKPDGTPYITLEYDGEYVRIRLHHYDPQNISVKIDRKAIPQLIEYLQLVKSK